MLVRPQRPNYQRPGNGSLIEVLGRPRSVGVGNRTAVAKTR